MAPQLPEVPGDELVINAFKEDGCLGPFVPSFEFRPEQAAMASRVWSALREGRYLLVEAGTGVGKSLAYLFPASLFSLSSGYRIIVSTYTVNLQEQLVSRDLPSIARFWRSRGASLRWGLVKGRGHYLCLRKFKRRYEQAVRQTDLFRYTRPEEDLIRSIERVVGGNAPPRPPYTEGPGANVPQEPGAENPFAAGREWDGDVDKLGMRIPPDLWSEFASDSESCMGTKCPHRSQCFYRAARSSLDQMHILVVNHALLASDLRLYTDTEGKTSLLPSYENLILDEAHHLESVVREHLGAHISAARLRRLAGDLLREARSENLSRFVGKEQLERLRDVLDRAAGALDATLEAIVREAGHGGDWERTRLTKEGFIDPALPSTLRNVATTIGAWLDFDLTEEDRFELSSIRRRFVELARDLEDFSALEGDGVDTVYWVERAAGSGSARVETLRSCPLEVSDYMKDNLWARIRCAVLTSATLAVGQREPFAYIRSSLGLNSCEELILGSPFDYREQACLCIPECSRGQDPNSPEFLEYVARVVPEIVDLTSGRCFVLFTSYRAMDSVVQKVRDVLEEKGFPVLKQGDDSRENLLESFRTLGNAVLFGVDSFWEGVDVPGDALSCVVLVRLPFPVPDDPVVQARSEIWKAQGKSPFWTYFLPTAALKLKQGFGRLIRSKTDRGAVVILDPRIATREYGRVLLDSLPPARITTDLEELARAVNPPGRKP